MNETAYIGEAAGQRGVSPEHLRTLERVGHIPPLPRDFNGRIYTKFDIALPKRSMVIGTKPEEVCVDGLKEVTKKWVIEALKKEQLARKEGARGEQEDTKKQGEGEVVANAQMCRN